MYGLYHVNIQPWYKKGQTGLCLEEGKDNEVEDCETVSRDKEVAVSPMTLGAHLSVQRKGQHEGFVKGIWRSDEWDTREDKLTLTQCNHRYYMACKVGPIQIALSLSRMDEGGAGKNDRRWRHRVEECMGRTCGPGQKEKSLEESRCLPYAYA